MSLLYSEESLNNFLQEFSCPHPYQSWRNSLYESYKSAYQNIEEILHYFSENSIVQDKIIEANNQILKLESFYTLLTELKVGYFLSKSFDSCNFEFIKAQKKKGKPDIKFGNVFIELNKPLKSNPYIILIRNELNEYLKSLNIHKKIFTAFNSFKKKPDIRKLSESEIDSNGENEDKRIRSLIKKVIKECKEKINISDASDNLLYKNDELEIKLIQDGVGYSERIYGTGFNTFKTYFNEIVKSKSNSNGLSNHRPNILWIEMLYLDDFELIEHERIAEVTNEIRLSETIDAILLTVCSFESQYEKIFERPTSPVYLIINTGSSFYNDYLNFFHEIERTNENFRLKILSVKSKTVSKEEVTT